MRAIEKFDDLEYEQQWALQAQYGKQRPCSEETKLELWNNLISSLPNSVKIKSSNEINIGDFFVYTGKPRGTGMYVPKIGEITEIRSEGDKIRMSIEMIERGRGYEKVVAY